jgi:DNA-binding SARP family transcriptional activator
VSAAIVVRENLLERIGKSDPRLVVLEAPAGYGKSTAARQIAQIAGGLTRCDAQGSDSTLGFLQTLVAVLAAEGGLSEERLAAEIDPDNEDADAWSALALKLWKNGSTSGFFLIENAERALAHDETRMFLERLLNTPHEGRRRLFCSTTAMHVHVGRLNLRDRLVRLDAEQLGFTRAEIHQLFGEHTPEPLIDDVEGMTDGWPMSVSFLRWLHREGHSLAHLPKNLPRHGDFFDCIAKEVLQRISASAWDLLLAGVAVPDATAGEIAVALNQTPSSEVLAGLEALCYEIPGISKREGIFEPHALLRSFLKRNHANELRIVTIQAAERFASRGDAIRAAQLYVEVGDTVAAARMISGLESPSLFSLPSIRLREIMTRLDRSALMEYPSLWASVVSTRARSLPRREWLHEGLEIWDRNDGGRALSADIRVNVGIFIVNAYLNLGMLDEADAFLKELADGISAQDARLTQVVVYWKVILDTKRGCHVDLALIEDRCSDVLSNEWSRAMFLFDAVALVYRFRGERDAERVASTQAIALALRAGVTTTTAMALREAAFGAWIAGEDALVAEYLDQIEDHLVPACAASEARIRHFLDCARGKGATAKPGHESMRGRVYGWLLAVGNTQDSGERCRFAKLALEAAETSNEAYLCILARVLCALVEPDRRDLCLQEALQFAKNIDEGRVLASAIEALLRKEIPVMFSALVDRFAVRSTETSISILQGNILLHGQLVELPKLQLEVILLLALEQRIVHRDVILAQLWPDSDPQKAAAILRVMVNRLRKLPGLREAIITMPRSGYKLAPSVRVDLHEIEILEAKARGHIGTFDDHLELRLWDAFAKLIARESRRKLNREWFTLSEQRIVGLLRRIARLLIERAPLSPENATTQLSLGRRLVNDDPYEELGHELVVRAHLAQGDEAAALLEISAYEQILSLDEAEIEPSELRSLLATKR